MIAVGLWALAAAVFVSSWLLSRWILSRREKNRRTRGPQLMTRQGV